MISPEKLKEAIDNGRAVRVLSIDDIDEIVRGFVLLGEVLSYMGQATWLEIFTSAPTQLVHEARKLVQETFIL